MGQPLAIVTSQWPIVPTGIYGRMMLRSARVKVIAITCDFLFISTVIFIIIIIIIIIVIIISPVSEGSGDVMVLRRSRPSPAARHPPPAARNGVNAITQKPRDGLFSNLVYTLVVILSWPD